LLPPDEVPADEALPDEPALELDDDDEDAESLPRGVADPTLSLLAGRPRSCAHAGDRLTVNAAAARLTDKC